MVLLATNDNFTFRKSLADESLVVMETGEGSPCIDLRSVMY